MNTNFPDDPFELSSAYCDFANRLTVIDFSIQSNLMIIQSAKPPSVTMEAHFQVLKGELTTMLGRITAIRRSMLEHWPELPKPENNNILINEENHV